MAEASARNAGRVALVIGNANYEHVEALPNPINDALGVAGSLEDIGFRPILKYQNLDFEATRAALRAFREMADGAEIAAIYFAGHGVSVAGTNYLIPVDARLSHDRDVANEASTLSHFLDAVAGASKLQLVIVDACRRNPFLRTMRRSNPTRDISRGLAEIEPHGNMLVAYAAKGGSLADDGSGLHSPYAQALMQFLPKPGLEVQFLFRRVRDAVLKATAGAQTPIHFESLGADPIYLVPPGPEKKRVTLAFQPDIFISYAREDIALAAELARQLETRGFAVWWDKKLPAGVNYYDVTDAAIDQSKATIVIWSEDSVESDWVIYEANRSLNRSIPLLPVRATDSILKKIRPPFSNQHTLAFDDYVGLLTELANNGIVPSAAPKRRRATKSKRDREEDAWNALRDSTNPCDFERFITRFSTSPRAPSAARRCEQLLAAESDPEILGRYIFAYSTSPRISIARGRLARIEWQAARGSNDEKRIRTFIQRFPDTPEASTAKQDLARLIWTSIAAINDPVILERFAGEFSGTLEADQALQRARALDRSSIDSIQSRTILPEIGDTSVVNKGLAIEGTSTASTPLQTPRQDAPEIRLDVATGATESPAPFVTSHQADGNPDDTGQPGKSDLHSTALLASVQEALQPRDGPGSDPTAVYPGEQELPPVATTELPENSSPEAATKLPSAPSLITDPPRILVSTTLVGSGSGADGWSSWASAHHEGNEQVAPEISVKEPAPADNRELSPAAPMQVENAAASEPIALPAQTSASIKSVTRGAATRTSLGSIAFTVLLIAGGAAALLGWHYAQGRDLCGDPSVTDSDQIIRTCSGAIARKPGNPDLFASRGLAYVAKADLTNAVRDFDDAIRLSDKLEYFKHRFATLDRLGDRERALQDYDVIAGRDPQFRTGTPLNVNYAPILIRRGDGLSAAKDFDKAIHEYDRAIALSPTAAVYAARAFAHLNKNNFDQAIFDYTRAIDLGAATGDNFDNRRLAREKTGDFDGALQDYLSAAKANVKFSLTKLTSGYAPAFTRLADASFSKGDLDGAIAYYDRAIGLDPKFAPAFAKRGTAYLKKNVFDQATVDISEAIKLGPSTATLYDSRRLAHEGKGDYDRALADYESAAKADPKYGPLKLSSKYAPALTRRAEEFYAKRDLDKALADFTRAIELAPGYTQAYVGRGLLRDQQKDMDAAISDFDRALKIDSKNANALYHRGRIKFDKGKVDAAIEDLDAATRLDPRNASAFSYVGQAYYRKGDDDRAIVNLTKAVQLDQTLVTAFNSRGLAYFRKKDFDRALPDFDAVVGLDPSRPYGYHSRGTVRYLRDDLPTALADFNAALAIDPNAADTLGLRGLVYAAMKDYDRAIADYDAALSFIPNDEWTLVGRRGAYKGKIESLEDSVTSQAVPIYQAAVSSDPKFSEWLALPSRFAEVFFRNGNAFRVRVQETDATAEERDDIYAKALDYYNQALKADPEHGRARNARCWLRAIWKQEQVRLKLALDDCNEAVRLLRGRDTANYYSSLASRGVTYLKLGRNRDAIADFTSVIDQTSLGDARSRTQAFYGRGLAKRKLGDMTAESDFSTALSFDASVAATFSSAGLQR